MKVMLKEVLFGLIWQIQHLLHARLNHLRLPQRRHRVRRPSAEHQIVDRAFLPEPKAEALHVADEPLVAARFGVSEKSGQGRAGELLLRPALDGLQSPA